MKRDSDLRKGTIMNSSRIGLAACAVATVLTACLLTTPATLADVGANASLRGLEAKFVDVEGVRTRYYEVGKGDPMVLVHGSGWSGTASANTWAPNIAGLGERFHVFAADKLGSGMTGNPEDDADLTIRGEVEHMYNFIKTMKLGKVHLVGQSRGGGLSFLLAVNHPDVVRTLVIVDSATAAPPAGDDRANRRRRIFRGCVADETTAGDRFRCRQKALSYDPDTVTDDFVDAAAYMWRQPKSQETLKRMTSELRRRNGLVTSEMNHDAYHRILMGEALPMPVLLYWAKNDPSVLPAQAYAFYNIIAETNDRAWLLFTNRAGHFHYREHPEEFNRNVINFVTSWE